MPWYYRTAETVSGPVSSGQLKCLAQAQTIHPDTMLRREGQSTWVTARNVQGLFPGALPGIAGNDPAGVAEDGKPRTSAPGQRAVVVEPPPLHRPHAPQLGTTLVVKCPHCGEILRMDAGTCAQGHSIACRGCARKISTENGRVCDHVAFVSYSKKDFPIAERVCQALERAQFRCWIAPRDIHPGDKWGSTIVEAIEGSRALVLIHSAHANRSQQVVREVERAVAKRVVILPVRIDDSDLSPELEYFLGAVHWMDGTARPVDEIAEMVVAMIRLVMEKKITASANAVSVRSKRRFRQRLLLVFAFAVVFGLGYVTSFAVRGPTLQEKTNELAGTIISTVAHADWEQAGGTYAIAGFEGALSIRADRNVHRQVFQFLEGLRRQRGLPAQATNREEESAVVQRAFAALDTPTTIDFTDMPLGDICDFLAELHSVPIYLDIARLADVGCSVDVPITVNDPDATLRSGLNRVLEGLRLVYVVRENGIAITTEEGKSAETVTRSYDVRDILSEHFLPTIEKQVD